MDAWLRLAGCWLTLVVAAARAADIPEPTAAEERAFAAAVDRVAAAVVQIDAQPTRGAGRPAAEPQLGTGPATGLIVGRHGSDAAGAWIIATSFAVPDDATQAVVQAADGTRAVGAVAARDTSRGLVLLSAGPLPASPALEPVPRADLRPGQWTIAIGRGWGAPGVSVGILSAVTRAWGRAVQTDASVSPMNYGGPLVDIRGRVIGILAPFPAELAGLPLGTELYDSGIGFAVPLEDVLAVLPRLEAGETLVRGILGIGYRSADQINGLPVIGSCRQASPAAGAGLRPGDRIVAVDGHPTGRIADVRERIAPRYAGDTLELTLERPRNPKPERITTRVSLVASLPPRRRGVIGVLPETPGSAAADGVVVAATLPGGPAAAAGIRPGDLLEWIARAPAEAGSTGAAETDRVAGDAPATLASFLAGIEPGTAVEVGTRRAGQTSRHRLITVTPPAEPPQWGVEQGQGADRGEGTDRAVDPTIDVEIVPLAAPEVADPPLAVIPRRAPGAPAQGGRAGGVLIWFEPPRGPGPRADAEARTQAAVWRAAAAAHGVAIILPTSGDPRRWSPEDLPGIRRAVVTLNARWPVDPARIATAGRAAGGTFAWLVAERLGAPVAGVALLDAPLPRQATIEPDESGRARWVLLGGGNQLPAERIAADGRRLQAAGITVGSLEVGADATPTDGLCRWVTALGLL